VSGARRFGAGIIPGSIERCAGSVDQVSIRGLVTMAILISGPIVVRYKGE
jgi:hypothetical protein